MDNNLLSPNIEVTKRCIKLYH